MNDWLQELIEAAARPVFNMLGSTVLGTPELKSQDMARARQLWGVSQTIANTCFVLVVSAAGILIMAGQSLPGELTPRQLLPRVVLAFLAANLSLTFLGYGVSLANGLAQAFLDGGPEKINARVLADTLVGSVLTSVATGGAFLPLVALVVIGLAVCVAFIYVARLAITMVLVAIAPLALMFHALPMTDGLARFWWRGISGILAIQVCQALVLVTAVQLLFTETKDTSGDFAGVPTKNDLTDLLLAICLLWVLIRIPAWVARTIWRPAQPRMLGQMAKTFLIYRGVGALMSKVGRSSALRSGADQRPGRGRAVPIGTRERKRRRPAPLPTNPRSPSAPQGPSPSGGPETTPTPGGRPVQLTLPIPHDSETKPTAKKRPVQLALPIPAPRVAPRPAPPPLPTRPSVRSRQLMFPGMPKRPVPHRQMALRLDPPKRSRGRKP
ncbi:hypothetical protein [Actinomadura sp. 9N407]|uniref:hypothetical protein n=1 Tax=Actinomadura sp. 9N407 TaxID=3375154 RepID=UPI00379717D9